MIKRAETSGRADDTEEVIRHRQDIYDQETATLVPIYRERGLLREVDGIGPVFHDTFFRFLFASSAGDSGTPDDLFWFDGEDVHRVAGLLQDIVISGASTEPVGALVDALVDGFFAVYADQPASSLLDDLDLTRDDVVAHAQALVARILEHAAASGTAERLIRRHLEPFFASPEVAAILG